MLIYTMSKTTHYYIYRETLSRSRCSPQEIPVDKTDKDTNTILCNGVSTLNICREA